MIKLFRRRREDRAKKLVAGAIKTELPSEISCLINDEQLLFMHLSKNGRELISSVSSSAGYGIAKGARTALVAKLTGVKFIPKYPTLTLSLIHI